MSVLHDVTCSSTDWSIVEDGEMVAGEVVVARKPFSAFLIEQRGGLFHAELSEALQALAAAVAEHGKKGSVTVTVTITPMPNGVGQYIVSDDVKAKIPEGDRGASLFFVDDAGNLSRSNPRQPELPLRDASAVDRPIREVS